MKFYKKQINGTKWHIVKFKRKDCEKVTMCGKLFKLSYPIFFAWKLSKYPSEEDEQMLKKNPSICFIKSEYNAKNHKELIKWCEKYKDID